MSKDEQISRALGRRGFLFGGAAIGAGVVLSGCTNDSSESGGNERENIAAPSSAASDAPGEPVTIGFSAPQADHGWIAAITSYAKAQAEAYSEVTFKPVEGTNDNSQQISQVETLINEKPDIIVILPNDGKVLTATGRAAMEAGIPVINLDREFSDPLAYRTFIAGNNYGMGVAAAQFVIAQMKAKGVTNPVIGEIPGIDSLPLTQERSKGISDALKAAGFKVANRVPAEFTVESGEEAASNLLQAAPKLDAVWNHDDDQGVGVLQAIKSASRDEFIMIGGAGSGAAVEAIAADNSVLKATVTYSPSMSASAIQPARLIAQKKGMGHLVESEVPTRIILASETITKDNAADYKIGFK